VGLRGGALRKMKNNKIIQKKLKNEIKRYEKFIHGTDYKSAPAGYTARETYTNRAYTVFKTNY
jgi:hypothetical protein